MLKVFQVAFDVQLGARVEYKALLELVLCQPVEVEVEHGPGVKVDELLSRGLSLRHRCGSRWRGFLREGCMW